MEDTRYKHTMTVWVIPCTVRRPSRKGTSMKNVVVVLEHAGRAIAKETTVANDDQNTVNLAALKLKVRWGGEIKKVTVK